MNALLLIHWALVGLVTSAIFAGLFTFSRPVSGYIAGTGGVLSAVLLLMAGVPALLSLRGEASIADGHLQLNAFNSVWLVTVALSGLFISLFNCAWHRHPEVKANGLLVNLILAASVVSLVTDNMATLVATTEFISLAGYFLTGCQKSSQPWFVLGRLSTVLLSVACWLLWQRYGTLNYGQLHQMTDSLPLPASVLTLSLLGFGLQAGVIPLHGWVPQAHAQSAAPAAALFSSVTMKIGIYGVMCVSLMSQTLPLWWGVLVVLVGMMTAFIGGLYALMEHNINRLLAYHSLENTGIILLGLGCGLTGIALHEPMLTALGMAGGLYHLFNHSLFKTTLFLGAGAVWFCTGHYDIEKLGGIGKRMPAISLSMLIGLMAMAALPPLNGFAGEWVIYQSFFHLGTLPLWVARMLGPVLAVGLAITGALAVMCIAKVYGVMFLGAPRTQAAENVSPAPVLMKVSIASLALCCLTAGVAAPWLLPAFHHVIPVPLQTAQTVVSQPMITLVLVASPVLPFILMGVFRAQRVPHRSHGPAWVCGCHHEQAMVITATGFAQPVKAAFALLFTLRHTLNPVRWIPGWQSDGLPGAFRRLATCELVILLVVVAPEILK